MGMGAQALSMTQAVEEAMTSRQKQTALWGRYAKVYDRLARDYPLYVELMDRLQGLIEAYVPPGGTVLDAGCGTGNLATRLAERYRVMAGDHSPAMLELARDKSRGQTTGERFETLELDLLAPLPLPDASLDCVCAVHVLYALPDAAPALREFGRVLRPGGILVTANMVTRIAVGEALREIVSLYGWRRGVRLIAGNLAVVYYNMRLARQQTQGQMHYWSEDQFRALLQTYGFASLHQERTYTCSSDLVTISRRGLDATRQGNEIDG
jgi:ubiquinone/menaquinone biosynthesis C-methylase UbiE